MTDSQPITQGVVAESGNPVDVAVTGLEGLDGHCIQVALAILGCGVSTQATARTMVSDGAFQVRLPPTTGFGLILLVWDDSNDDGHCDFSTDRLLQYTGEVPSQGTLSLTGDQLRPGHSFQCDAFRRP